MDKATELFATDKPANLHPGESLVWSIAIRQAFDERPTEPNTVVALLIIIKRLDQALTLAHGTAKYL